MNRNPFKPLGLATLLLLAGFGRPALAEALQAGDPVAPARQLIAQLRAELKPVDDQIAAAPFLTALERHRVSLDALRAFTGEQYNILRSDLRSNAHMVSRFGAEPFGTYFLDLTTSEAEARRLLLDFARALGMTERDLQAYPSYAAWLAFYGSKSDIAAAYLVNFPVFGANTGRMAEALRRRYGFSTKDTAFFDYFAFLPPSFETDSLNVIQDGLNRGANPRDIRRAARLLQAYEKDFWYTVGQN
jgi:hypothetical protein